MKKGFFAVGTTLAVLLAVACGVETTEEVGTSTSAIVMPACGTKLNEIDGVWAYSNGVYEGTGSSCAGQTALGTLRYQCVEYAQRYMHDIYGIQPVWPVAVAAQMCTLNPSGTTVKWVSSGYAPKRGDLAVWTTNNYGHVAVVKSVRTDGIEIVEQNGAWSTIGTRVLPMSTGWGGVACFVTANANTGSGGGGSGVGTGGGNGPSSPCAFGAGLYCGGNGGGADRGTLYRCSAVGATPSVEQTCAMGCEWRPDGQNDRCRASATCPVGAGKYCGENGVSGSPNVLFDCTPGKITAVTRCARGCKAMPTGTDDACAP